MPRAANDEKPLDLGALDWYSPFEPSAVDARLFPATDVPTLSL